MRYVQEFNDLRSACVYAVAHIFGAILGLVGHSATLAIEKALFTHMTGMAGISTL